MPCEVREKLKAKIMETKEEYTPFNCPKSHCQVGISTLLHIDKEREALGGK